jgi:hypothetical protein
VKNYIPDKCPICENELTITELKCLKCGTHISGEFYASKFAGLSKDQLLFIENFIKCRGSIKEMEKEMGVSYPTVKGRLEEVADAMGYGKKVDEGEDVRRILDKIDRDEITVSEAMELIKERGK